MKENKKEKHQKTMWMARKRRKEEREERFVKNLKGSVANFVFFWISNLLIFECGKALNFVQFLNKLTVTYVFCFVLYIYFSLLLNKRSTSTYVWCMQMWIIWNALYEVSRSVKKKNVEYCNNLSLNLFILVLAMPQTWFCVNNWQFRDNFMNTPNVCLRLFIFFPSNPITVNVETLKY